MYIKVFSYDLVCVSITSHEESLFQFVLLKFFVQNSELMLEKWEILLVWEDWTKKYLCVLELIELEPFPPATCSVC